MSRFSDLVQSVRSQPGYTLMRGAARFRSVRDLVGGSRRLLHAARLRTYLADCEARMSQSVLAPLDRLDFVRRLQRDGIAFGLGLPETLTAEIVDYALREPCYADRRIGCGFHVDDRPRAESALGKPVLLAQYFNAASGSRAIGRLVRDPLLQWIAGSYLQSVPAFVGANLWWTFPVQALEQDRDRHAHLFHRDVDDFRFFKFFFYLTEVAPGDGAHVCVIGSHLRPPMLRPGDRWNIRRYSDAEVERSYPADRIVEICGPAGTGFAENTMCIHKGQTPRREPRLLLQLQFALFDHGVMHDRRDAATLQMLP